MCGWLDTDFLVHRSKKELYAGLVCVSTCEIGGEKWNKSKKTRNGASVLVRLLTFGKETLACWLVARTGEGRSFVAVL